MGVPVNRTIRIAILAMGGEGGGVLAGWIVETAEANGWIAQQTSIPGVAQRTGATNYYVELFPLTSGVGPRGSDTRHAEAGRADQGSPTCSSEGVGLRNGLSPTSERKPVMALSPMPGEVDIVLASELMEACRAIQRGIVTPDRTALVTSTGRVFAMTERLVPGDGRADETVFLEAARLAAHRLVTCDMGAAAEATGSVISAVMLGALAASRALPFDRAHFESAIERSGVGVSASKRGFARGFDDALAKPTASPEPLVPQPKAAAAPVRQSPFTIALTEAGTAYAEPLRPITQEAVRRLTDYQDATYARLYLDRLAPVAVVDREHGDGSQRLLTEVARYLALGMAYEDTIRVAELKIRSQRFARVAAEVKVEDGQALRVAEFLHPRLQEIAETVPAWLGRFLSRNLLARRIVGRFTREGRIVETTSLRGFLLMYAVASLKPRRRSSMRYTREQASIEAWLQLIAETAPKDYALATEIAECRNLVKGYGDTHDRGTAKYARILGLVPTLSGHTDPARHVALLRKAALADDDPATLETAIERLGLSPRPASEAKTGEQGRGAP